MFKIKNIIHTGQNSVCWSFVVFVAWLFLGLRVDLHNHVESHSFDTYTDSLFFFCFGYLYAQFLWHESFEEDGKEKSEAEIDPEVASTDSPDSSGSSFSGHTGQTVSWPKFFFSMCFFSMSRPGPLQDMGVPVYHVWLCIYCLAIQNKRYRFSV